MKLTVIDGGRGRLERAILEEIIQPWRYSNEYIDQRLAQLRRRGVLSAVPGAPRPSAPAVPPPTDGGTG